jgi:hypothetical protein
MFRYLLRLCFLLIITSSQAQPVFDVLQTQYVESPASAIYKGGDEAECTIGYFQAQANLPWKHNLRHITIFNPIYEARSFRISTPLGTSVQRYLSGALSVSHRMLFRDTTHHLLAALAIRHYGANGITPSENSITPAVALLYGRQQSEKFTWRLGAYYSRECFGNFWLPLLGFDWQASKNFRCWGILPRYAVFDYAITPRVHSCLFYKGITDSYREKGNDYFTYIEGQVRIGLEYYLPHTPISIHSRCRTQCFQEFYKLQRSLAGRNRNLPYRRIIISDWNQLESSDRPEFPGTTIGKSKTNSLFSGSRQHRLLQKLQVLDI